MGGFIVNLLAERIGHGGRIFVQVDALSPTAVDVVHEPLEGPQTTEKSKHWSSESLLLRDASATASMGVTAASYTLGRRSSSARAIPGLSEEILIGGI
jgi:hypothetical protein